MTQLGLMALCLLQLIASQVLTERSAHAAPWIDRAIANRVITASSPDNSFDLLERFFDSARNSIRISVYQLDSVYIGTILERALDRGVSVQILLEGSPIPKIPVAELYIADRLVKKGAKVFFYDLGEGRTKRDFRYFHAKYAVVDSKRVLVGSANYGKRGHPVDPSYGNREWEVAIDDPKAAKLFEKAFLHDIKFKEWVPYGAAEKYTFNDSDFEPDTSVDTGKYDLLLEPLEVLEVPVETVFAPENSLDVEGAILGTLASAESTVDIAQLGFETYWGNKPYNPEREARD